MTSAAICTAQSWRRTCASSWHTTTRIRSSLHRVRGGRENARTEQSPRRQQIGGVGLSTADGFPDAVALGDLADDPEPPLVGDPGRARRDAGEAQQLNQQRPNPAADSNRNPDHSDAEREGRVPVRLTRVRRRRRARSRNRWRVEHNTAGVGTTGHRPVGHHPGDRRGERRGGHRRGRGSNAAGRRTAAKHDEHRQPGEQQRRGPDQRIRQQGQGLAHRGSLRAFSTSAAMRSRSSSDSRLPSPPSSAATTLAFDPSKNVSTRCLSAERRAEWRGTVGM